MCELSIFPQFTDVACLPLKPSSSPSDSLLSDCLKTKCDKTVYLHVLRQFKVSYSIKTDLPSSSSGAGPWSEA